MNKLIKINTIVIFIKNKTTLFGIFLFIVILIESISTSIITDVGLTNIKVGIETAVFSSIALTLPYFIVVPKWRWSVWVILIPITICLLTNVIMQRVTSHFYWLSQINFQVIFSDIVIKSGLSAFRWFDILLVLPCVCLIIPFVLWRKQILTYRYNNSIRLGSLLLLVLLVTLMFFLPIRRYKIYQISKGGNANWKECYEYVIMLTKTPLYKEALFEKGSTLFLCGHYVYELFSGDLELSEAEETEIYETLVKPRGRISSEYADIVSKNKNKNLLLIIVESFNSSVFSDYAQQVNPTPYLNELISDSSVAVIKNVLTQVGEGISADGQFLYNTGLYPIVKRPWTAKIFRGKYPSLAKSLTDHYSVEAICEKEDFYSHDYTTVSYGYDSLYSGLSVGEKGIYFNSDTRLIDRVEKIIPTLKRPFFMEVTTLGMHSPYDDIKVNPVLDEELKRRAMLDSRAENYLESVCSFDYNLKRLIGILKSQGLYDDTVIVIVGDHNAFDTYLPNELHSKYTPMIILNGGVRIRRDEPIGQIDVYPTLIDLMGSKGYKINDGWYRGLGRSLISTTPPTGAINRYDEPTNSEINIDSIRNIWNISEKIIVSRYFGDI